MPNLEAECEFLRSLLSFSLHDAPRPLLESAMRILVQITGAREAYVELHGMDGLEEAGWHALVGDASRKDAIRAVISKGIIAEAIATGEVVVTSSALTDPRFKELESVRDFAIERVVCAPIGRDVPIGALYLRGPSDDPARALGPERLKEHVELFVSALAPVAERLVRSDIEERDARPVEPEGTDGGAFSTLIGRSEAFVATVTRARFAAPLDITVLLSGPTGSGKTLLASAMHRASARAEGAFVELNCAALPLELIENELFGAVEGGHSGVPRGGITGKVDAARGGTLFLDEVAELPLGSQAKLLQLLQNGVYYPLGSAAPRTSDARILVASNVDLATRVKEGAFREDLFYRLKVLDVRLPSLAEREQDVVPLARHFAWKASNRHGFTPLRLAPSALRAVAYAEWPGNVRELAHRMEAAVVHAQLRSAARLEAVDVFPDDPLLADEVGLSAATRAFQRRHVSSTLDAVDWNVSEAARQLDVARSHVYNLIKLHGLRRTKRGPLPG